MARYTQEEFDAEVNEAIGIGRDIDPILDGKSVSVAMMGVLLHLGALIAQEENPEGRALIRDLAVRYLDRMVEGLPRIGPMAQAQPAITAVACLKSAMGSVFVRETVQ